MLALGRHPIFAEEVVILLSIIRANWEDVQAASSSKADSSVKIFLCVDICSRR